MLRDIKIKKPQWFKCSMQSIKYKSYEEIGKKWVFSSLLRLQALDSFFAADQLTSIH